MFAKLRCGGNLPLSGIRYRRGPPMVRNMHAVLKKASWGTRRIGSIRCKKQAFPVRKRYSVHDPPPFSARKAFSEELGAQNSLLWYATHFQRPAEQPTPQTVDSLLPLRTHLQCAKRPPLGGEQT